MSVKYTPATLLEMAAKAQARYEELRVQFPPGTINRERNEARELSETALACASWMESHGHTELANVGPFMTVKPRPGSRVRIRKGSRIFSTHPSIGPEGTVSTRDQAVLVRSVNAGYVDRRYQRSSEEIVQGTVRWAGAGGYWRWTDINNVELLSQDETVSS